MRIIKIKKGLDLPIRGNPRQEITDSKKAHKFAVLGDEYVGMKPTMQVKVGDAVKKGQIIFTDKKMPEVKFTAPVAGKVIEINRGEKRRFISLVIQAEGEEEIVFKEYKRDELGKLDAEIVKKQLLDSGLWTALRSRPFGKTANPAGKPHSFFINAMDTNPFAPSVTMTLKGREDSFKAGIEVLSRLTDGVIHLCINPSEEVPVPDVEQLEVTGFTGKHPAGLTGTHIHFLDPVSAAKEVWYTEAQQVAMIGDLFLTGKINLERIVAIGGPGARNPRLVKVSAGASISEVMSGELKDGENRIISGSVLTGYKAEGTTDYLGFRDQIISVIPENRERKFLGWVTPPLKTFSVKNLALINFLNRDSYEFNTSTNGDKRPIVPIGSYEKVMPLDIIPTYLLRALAVEDIEDSENLGCLELVEEDLALCTYVCPSKIEHGVNLRKVLTTIEKEG
jgi:Na+-transporting NADH:ubiquinone oxidoreductase subunit A